MATRASIIFKEEGEPMCAVYNHWDGYPEGLGKTLLEITKNTQGLYGGSLFAKIIAKLQKDPDEIVEMCPIEVVGRQGEQFIYEVDENGKIKFNEDTLLVDYLNQKSKPNKKTK